MSEAGTRLRKAVQALKRVRRDDGQPKTADDMLADQAEYDAAMRNAKTFAAANPSVTAFGDRGWHEGWEDEE